MSGILQEVLVRRYGQPTIVPSGELLEFRWNEEDLSRRCVLYGYAARQKKEPRSSRLSVLYGDFLGGSILQGSLRVAMLGGPEVFSLYRIHELQCQPEVRRALAFDPHVTFFMDAANVWYYGIKNDDLYGYDSEFDELDLLGPASREIDRLLEEWEEAGRGKGSS